jgi:hypothetical protein
MVGAIEKCGKATLWSTVFMLFNASINLTGSEVGHGCWLYRGVCGIRAATTKVAPEVRVAHAFAKPLLLSRLAWFHYSWAARDINIDRRVTGRHANTKVARKKSLKHIAHQLGVRSEVDLNT